MVSITALADETLHMIFAQIDSTKQLAQCRLTCKRFDGIAEQAMFNSHVVIRTEDQALSLLQHLSRCQRRGIKHFHWGLTSSTAPPTLKHLLPMILHSNTVSLTGCVQGRECYDLIDDIVEQFLPTEKPQLISLPHPDMPDKYYYRKLLKYGDTLQSAYILIDIVRFIDEDIVNHIREFPKLKSLVIKGSIFVWRAFLQIYSEQLEELELEFDMIEANALVNRAMYEHLVQPYQSDNMKKLVLKGACTASYLEAFMYMYPKVETVLLDITFQSRPRISIIPEMNRIMKCLVAVAHKELIITSINGASLKELILHLKNKGHDINIPAIRHDSDIRMYVGGLD